MRRPLPPCRYHFPDPESGEGPQGIVGTGADFAPGTLLHAYHRGIFPWPAPQLRVVLWCSPDPRAVFPLDREPRWSRSLSRKLRQRRHRISVDEAFEAVMDGCADREGGTWITPELAAGYRRLHAMGWAHSLEAWSEAGELVGGIYGVAVGGAFSAESMFHRETDASKIAFANLVERLRPRFTIFDAQVMTPHLASLGCVEIPRAEFLARLAGAAKEDVPFPT